MKIKYILIVVSVLCLLLGLRYDHSIRPNSFLNQTNILLDQTLSFTDFDEVKEKQPYFAKEIELYRNYFLKTVQRLDNTLTYDDLREIYIIKAKDNTMELDRIIIGTNPFMYSTGQYHCTLTKNASTTKFGQSITAETNLRGVVDQEALQIMSQYMQVNYATLEKIATDFFEDGSQISKQVDVEDGSFEVTKKDFRLKQNYFPYRLEDVE